MTDERNPKISAAYRELGAEEPPRALDDAILAAARRAAGARPGSPGRAAPQRWYAPLAAAAVLVLAVAVTLHMQIERPDIAQPAPAAKQPATAPAPAAAPAPAPAASEAEAQLQLRVEPPLKSAARERAEVANAAVKEEAKPVIPKIAAMSRPAEPEPFPATDERGMAERRIAAAPKAAAPAPAPAPAPSAAPSSRADEARGTASSAAGALARQVEDRASREAVAAAPAPQAAPMQSLEKRAAGQASPQADTPERELERIAELRRQGRHDEADKALAEFRKRYPEFRIPEAMRERVERR